VVLEVEKSRELFIELLARMLVRAAAVGGILEARVGRSRALIVVVTGMVGLLVAFTVAVIRRLVVEGERRRDATTTGLCSCVGWCSSESIWRVEVDHVRKNLEDASRLSSKLEWRLKLMRKR